MRIECHSYEILAPNKIAVYYEEEKYINTVPLWSVKMKE